MLAANTAAKALSPTVNRRVTVWIPDGDYLLTGTWNLDTFAIDYRSITSVDGMAVFHGFQPPVHIYCAPGLGAPLIRQTADYIGWYGITTNNQGSSHPANPGTGDYLTCDIGFLIDCDNTNSVYYGSYFDNHNGLRGGIQMDPTSAYWAVTGVIANIGRDLDGTWTYCFSDYGWRLAQNRQMVGTWDWCWGGYAGFGGDATLASINGTLRHCGGESAVMAGVLLPAADRATRLA